MLQSMHWKESRNERPHTVIRFISRVRRTSSINLKGAHCFSMLIILAKLLHQSHTMRNGLWLMCNRNEN